MKYHACDPLVTLVHALDDGIEFYRIAEQKSRSPRLQRVFARMADIREFALAHIRPYLDMHDQDLEKALSDYGPLNNRFTPLLERIVLDEPLRLVKDVEEHLIEAMITASVETKNALAQCVLTELIPHIAENFDAAQAEMPLERRHETAGITQ